jgi:hypothetical protein
LNQINFYIIKVKSMGKEYFTGSDAPTAFEEAQLDAEQSASDPLADVRPQLAEDIASSQIRDDYAELTAEDMDD